MHNYTGNPNITLVDPPVISEISDSDNLDQAHLNPPIEELTDYVAAWVHFGAKTNTNNTFNGNVTIVGTELVASKATFNANTQFRIPTSLANVSDQTVNPNTAGTNTFLLSVPAGVQIIRLDTASVSDGDWAEFICTQSVGANQWVFRRGSDNTANICTFNWTPNQPINQTAVTAVLSGNTVIDGAYVKLMRVGGVWRMIAFGGNVLTGAYA